MRSLLLVYIFICLIAVFVASFLSDDDVSAIGHVVCTAADSWEQSHLRPGQQPGGN